MSLAIGDGISPSITIDGPVEACTPPPTMLARSSSPSITIDGPVEAPSRSAGVKPPMALRRSPSTAPLKLGGFVLVKHTVVVSPSITIDGPVEA